MNYKKTSSKQDLTGETPSLRYYSGNKATCGTVGLTVHKSETNWRSFDGKVSVSTARYTTEKRCVIKNNTHTMNELIPQK